jgi:hypothetical protein
MKQRSLSLVSSMGSVPALVFVAAMAIALVSGALLAVIDPMIGVLLITLLLGLAVVIHKEVLLYFCMLIALLVSGLAQLYYPPLSFVRWTVPITASLLMIHFIPTLIGSRAKSRSLPWFLRWAMLFLAVAIFSSALHWRGGFGFVQGIKLYFQLWGLMFAVALIAWRPVILDTVLKALFVLALIQLPFAIHQYFFIAPEREGLWRLLVVPLDVVSGTMGAERFGSGKNSVLGIYLISVVGVLFSLWREKAVKAWIFLLALPCLLAPLFLNESKFALVLLLAVLGYVFRRDVYQRPFRFLLISILTGLLAIALLASYSASFGKGKTIAETVQATIDSNIGSRGYASHVLNRMTAMSFWAKQHGIDDLPGTLIGHGLGASHESSESVLASSATTLADRQYKGYGIGLTGISSILWDTGIIGLLAIVSVFAAAFLSAGRLSRYFASDPWRRGIFEGFKAVILAAGLMLFHSNYFVVDPSLQSLIYFVFGYIGFWTLRVAAETTASR